MRLVCRNRLTATACLHSRDSRFPKYANSLLVDWRQSYARETLKDLLRIFWYVDSISAWRLAKLAWPSKFYNKCALCCGAVGTLLLRNRNSHGEYLPQLASPHARDAEFLDSDRVVSKIDHFAVDGTIDMLLSSWCFAAKVADSSSSITGILSQSDGVQRS